MNKCRLCGVFALVLSLFFAVGSFAQVPGANNKHLWNLQEANIRSIIAEVAKVTGKNFIVAPSVQGKISLVSATPISNDKVYPLFLNVLQVLGLRAVPVGHSIKIIPADKARFASLPVLSKNAHGQPGGAMIVRVIALKFISARNLLPSLTPLLPSTASISAYLPSNVLILAGVKANVDKIAAIIHQVDSSSAQNITIIRLRHAIAANVVETLKTLNTEMGGTHVGLAAIAQSNSVLVSGNRTQRVKYRLLIDRLDARGQSSNGNTEVVYLHYRKAKAMVPLLMSIAKAAYGNEVGSSSNAPAKKGKKLVVSPMTNTSAHHVVVDIAADTTLNALVITAPNGLRRVLKRTIARLDLRPAQVLVQAMVVEVSQQTLDQLGIQWGTRSNGADGTPFSTLTGGLGLGFLKTGSFRALIQAMRNNTNNDILSTPTLVVMDNQKASIKVGRMVPFQSGAYETNQSNASASSNAISNPYSTFERKFVGLHLDVTPQINQGNAVELSIDQGDASIIDNSSTAQSFNPQTSQSNIATSVLVNDGETLVLGGLTRNEHDEVSDKVPFFSSIPLLGHLFVSQKKTVVKKTLLVFLRPVIIHTAKMAGLLTNGKYAFARNQQMSIKGGSDLVLPPWQTDTRATLPSPF